MLADEIEHQARLLPLVKPQPAAQLLKEERGARTWVAGEASCRRTEGRRLHCEIAREQDVHFASVERTRSTCPIFLRTLAVYRERSNAQLTKFASHEIGMRDAHAESERAHTRQIHRFQPDGGADLQPVRRAGRCRCRGDPGLRGVGAATPAGISEVDTVVQVHNTRRGEQLSFERVPEAQLGSDVAIEVGQQRAAVAPFGRRRKAQEQARADVLDEGLVGGSWNVVAFVDHHVFPVLALRIARAGRVN